MGKFVVMHKDGAAVIEAGSWKIADNGTLVFYTCPSPYGTPEPFTALAAHYWRYVGNFVGDDSQEKGATHG